MLKWFSALPVKPDARVKVRTPASDLMQDVTAASPCLRSKRCSLLQVPARDRDLNQRVHHAKCGEAAFNEGHSAAAAGVGSAARPRQLRQLQLRCAVLSRAQQRGAAQQ